MFISFRVKFDKGFWYEMDIENMRFFCCQVYSYPFYGALANSAEPDQMSQIAAFYQVIYCLLTYCSIRIRLKMKNTTQQPFKWKWTGPINKSGKSH